MPLKVLFTSTRPSYIWVWRRLYPPKARQNFRLPGVSQMANGCWLFAWPFGSGELRWLLLKASAKPAALRPANSKRKERYRKENTQVVLYPGPGQRVLCAFFARVFLRNFARFCSAFYILLTHGARFLLRSATALLPRFQRVFFRAFFLHRALGFGFRRFS